MTDPRNKVSDAIENGNISMDDIEYLSDELKEEGWGSDAHKAIDELFEHTYDKRDVKVTE